MIGNNGGKRPNAVEKIWKNMARGGKIHETCFVGGEALHAVENRLEARLHPRQGDATLGALGALLGRLEHFGVLCIDPFVCPDRVYTGLTNVAAPGAVLNEKGV